METGCIDYDYDYGGEYGYGHREDGKRGYGYGNSPLCTTVALGEALKTFIRNSLDKADSSIRKFKTERFL